MAQHPLAEPFELFDSWYKEAQAKEPNDANAMALATVGSDGMPAVRMVLLKEADPRGFVFYTNHESRKGEQLHAHPMAALCFHWKSLRKSVRVEGVVTPTTPEEADAYFATRHRASQIGAWASAQSRPLASREIFEERIRDVEARFAGVAVTRPEFWSGWRLVPDYFEFWQGIDYRLHDRLVFAKTGEGWETGRLFP